MAAPGRWARGPAEDVPALARRLAEAATAAGLAVATAESCTGGRLAAAVTAAAGASSFYVGGVVAYADEAKAGQLQVDPDEMQVHGAVSREVALAMAAGALAQFDAGLAMAVTGIAGPGGGTPEKPVGTVWVAAAARGRSEARRSRFRGGRRAVQDQSVAQALAMGVQLARAQALPDYL